LSVILAIAVVAVNRAGVSGAATWDRLGPGRDGTALGPHVVKGKREPVQAWVLRGLEPSASDDQI
jgi:class 3 adenylate cyclase